MKDAVAHTLGALHPTATDNALHGDTLAQAPRPPGDPEGTSPGAGVGVAPAKAAPAAMRRRVDQTIVPTRCRQACDQA